MPCDGLEVPGVAPRVCEPGGGGLILPLLGETELKWEKPLRAGLYLAGLLWCFMGVAIIADVFMAAIEKITSKKVLAFDKALGKRRTVTVWNPTVANLTLMALGSSAPEILLNIVGIFPTFQSGALGPGTIVGSAAFNLLCISAVCVVAVPNGEVRKINDLGVYSITATFSIFAYLWLLVILVGTTPDVVETWEGVVTFLFFWVFVLVAFFADKGWLPGTAKGVSPLTVQPESSHEEIAEMELQVRQKYGQQRNLKPEQVSLLIAYAFPAPHSRATHRVNATRSLVGGRILLGGGPTRHDQGRQLARELEEEMREQTSKLNAIATGDAPMVQFQALNYSVLESVGQIKVKVKCYGNIHKPVEVKYATRDGSAKAEDDYEPTAGTLRFDSQHTVQDITVKIKESPGTEDTEEFYVDLLNGPLGKMRTVTIVIIDEDQPGKFRFEREVEEFHGQDHDEDIEITVRREGGSSGEVRCNYATEDGSAKEGADYEQATGTLVFADGQQSAKFRIKIKANSKFEGTEMFRVMLTDAEGGAGFDNTTDGGSDSCILTVVILADESRKAGIEKLAGLMRVNMDNVSMGNASYKEQLHSALFAGGSWADQREASWFEMAAHIIALPWKLLFALVPPTEYAGGWLCFSCALLMIGVVTVIIGDMAELLGCVLKISDETTAISLVAMGTSLPDTFASKTAAQMDPTADNSIGNITGSNSVNVFLGLGLPWMIAAIFWQFAATCEPGDSWSLAYPEQALEYPEGIFVVKAGSLALSVMVFCFCGGVCIATLALRRKLFGGELGGPRLSKIGTAIFFVLLWATYIVISIILED